MNRVLAVVALVGVAVASARPADACINHYGTNVHGEEVVYTGNPSEYLRRITYHAKHQAQANAPLGPAPAADADFKLRSDHAAALVYHGRAAEAVTLLEAVERDHPGEYIVAANLGTAYELAGDDVRALRWITEGVRRNPQAHLGSEWLHVRILEAKLALAADPRWLETHSVLGVDFGTGRVPKRPRSWPDGKDHYDVENALVYQLHERTGFVAPPEPIVADLLADLGNLIASTKTVQHAAAIYDLALTYQPVHAALIRERRAYLDTVPPYRSLVERALPWVAILVGAGAALLVVRSRRRRAQARLAR